MPNIRQFETEKLGLQPSEIGVEATAAAARRGGAFFNQAAQDATSVGHMAGSAIKDVGDTAIQYETHREVSAGAKDLAARTSNLTDQWNKLAKDPNDPSIAAKFRETVLEPELESFAGNFHTEAAQKWAEGHVAALRQHMFEKTTADMSTLAGEAAKVNHRQTENFLSNTAYNDPSSLKFSLDTLRSATEATIDSSPNLTAVQRGQLKTELMESGAEKIVKSAAVGYIEKTGKVPTWTSDPAYSKYVNGIELRQFQKAADAQTKANLYYDRQAEVLKKQQADLAVHKDAGALIANGVTVDPNNPSRVLVAPEFMQKALDIARRNPDAPSAAATAKTMIDWAESQHRQRADPVLSDPATKAGLLAGMFDPNKPTSEIDILKAEAADKLSTRDGTILRQLVTQTGPAAMHDPIVKAAIDAAGERTGLHLMADGHERYSNFIQSFWPEYLRQKNAGTLKPNALDMRDENSLIRQSMKPFEPDMAERMRAHALKSMGVTNLEGLNLGGQGEKVLGVEVKNAPPLPGLDVRKVGSVYETARGRMKWTGTGWVPP